MARSLCRSFLPGRPGWICASAVDALISGQIPVDGMSLREVQVAVLKNLVDAWSVESDRPLYCVLSGDPLRVTLTPAAKRTLLDQLDEATTADKRRPPTKADRVLLKMYAEREGIDYEGKMNAVKARAADDAKPQVERER